MPNLKKTDRREPLKAFHCVVCGKDIDLERVVRKAVTCSEEHARIYIMERRRLRAELSNRCRSCNRPSSPAERAEFAAWRKDQAKQAGIKPGPKPKPKDVPETPLEQHLGTIAVQ